MKNVLILIFCIGFCLSCQEEGEPLTVDAVNELNTFNTTPFSATINGSQFKGKNVSGIRANGQTAITALIDNNIFVIGIEKLEQGVFLGANNSIKNYVTFQNAGGNLFNSTKQGKNSDLVVEITAYDEARKLVSGIMRGTLHAPWNESISLRNGKFNNVLIEIPFNGEMNATAGSIDFSSEVCIHSSSTANGIVLDVIAASANSDSLSLNMTIEENLKVKQYNFNNQNATARFNSNVFSTNVFKHQYTSTSGSLNIVSIDTAKKQIEGNFQFNAENLQGQTIQVTGGNFKALMK